MFLFRWNAIKSEKAKFQERYPFLIPQSYERLYDIPAVLKTPSSSVNSQVRNGFSFFPFPLNRETGRAHVFQVLRSVSSWSAGIDDIEASIHEAYIQAINDSEHFIYIENQFFITSAGDQKEVKNSIGNALFRRICKAAK